MPTPIEDLRAYWNDRLPRDLAPFGDPGTTLELVPDKYSFFARWTSRGRPLEATFTVSLDALRVSFRGQLLSYRSFLAGPQMADLQGLAKMMLQSQQPQLYIPTKATRADDSAPGPLPAVDLLQDLLGSSAEAGLTRILFVTGEAGAGKTHALRELVRQQAKRYLQHSSDQLYLYVNAQGRALARFHEALATELQDLRATVTYHAVSTLVRAGILVPVIDGFDELLGIGGYDDAFSSLAAFIEELDGLGQFVASARSTYYELEFVTRADSASSLGAQAWTLIPIEVLAWGDDEFNLYVQEISALPGRPVPHGFGQLLRRAFTGVNADLRKKPLLVAKTAELVLAGAQFATDRDLLTELVTAYLERERTQKLLDRAGTPILTTAQLTALMTAFAEEMWNSETRELDGRFVREIAAITLDSANIPSAEVVVQRMPSLALLTRGESPGGVAFEHEMFFAYFLSRTFTDRLQRDPAALRLLLGRSILPSDVARLTVSSLFDEEPDLVQLILDELLEKLGVAATDEGSRSGQIRENAGLLVATSLTSMAPKLNELTGKRLRRIVFPGGDLSGVSLRDCILDNVEFRRVDLSKTRFLQCRSIASSFVDVIVDPSYTRLELAGIDVRSHFHGLRRRPAALAERIHDPVEFHRVLAECGAVEAFRPDAPTIRAVDGSVIALLDRLVRAYGRTNPVCISDDNLRPLFRDPKWAELEKALLASGVVSKESRATGGPQKHLRLLKNNFSRGVLRVCA